MRTIFFGLGLACALAAAPPGRAQEADDPRVLAVVANFDFDFEEYVALRDALAAAGVRCEVAAPDALRAASQRQAAQMDIRLDLADVDPALYEGLVILGGRGAVTLQDAFPGAYVDPGYDHGTEAARTLSRLMGAFIAAGKKVGAGGHGVSVLAWARIDGKSPIHNRSVRFIDAPSPAFVLDGILFKEGERTIRWHVEQNGAIVADGRDRGRADDAADDLPPVLFDPPDDFKPPTKPATGAEPEPTGPLDDVIIDGPIITGDSFASLGRAMARAVRDR